MKVQKVVLFLIMILLNHFVAHVCLAQDISHEILLSLSEKKNIGRSISTTSMGAPVILTEPIRNDDSQTKDDLFLSKSSSIPSNQYKKIKIRTPFGHTREADFMDQITDAYIAIHILDDKTLYIEEDIQYIQTQKNAFFTRNFPKRSDDTHTKSNSSSIRIIKAMKDKKPISLKLTEDPYKLSYQFTKPLEAGFHHFTIGYTKPLNIIKDHSFSEMIIDIMNDQWEMPTERFSILVFFPQKAQIYQKELLFGNNNTPSPQSYLSKIDDSGTVIYQMKHPLPAFSNIKIHIIADASSIFPKEFSFVTQYPKTLRILTIISVFCIYTLLTIWSCRRKKWKKPLRDMERLHPILWRIGLDKKISPAFLSEIQDVQNDAEKSPIKNNFILRIAYWQRNKGGLRLISSCILNGLMFIRFNFEYIIGLSILCLTTYKLHQAFHIDMSALLQVFLLVFSCVILISIHYWGTKIELKNLATQTKQTLKSPQCLAVAPHILIKYYILAICLNFQKEWLNDLSQYNPLYTQLPQLKRKEQR